MALLFLRKTSHAHEPIENNKSLIIYRISL